MLSEVRNQLKEAVEGLYLTFAAYPLRQQINACDHCVFPEDHARLRSKPLRDLQEEDLSKYAHKAMTTWGDDLDFRHFLPRLLELVADGSTWPVSVDRLIEYKLLAAEWHHWPEAECGAIENYMLALWTFQLTRVDNSYALQEILPSASKAGIDISPYLDVWASLMPENTAAVLNLCEFIYDIVLGSEICLNNSSGLQASSSDSPHWDELIVAWLLAPSLTDTILRAADLPQFASELDRLNITFAQLEWLHTIPKQCISISN